MTRLQSEWHRLYVPLGTPATADRADLIGPHGEVRALVMEVSHPADWSVLSKVWQGVQADWAWPAPGIAVSGHDGYQLWFSLAQAVPVAQGRAWLSALQKHYLGDVPAARVHLWPLPDALAPRGVRHALPIPTEPTTPGQWSAFVAPDLAPVFVDTPWLDIPPSPEGQADLLSRLVSISGAEWAAAQERLAAPAPTTATTATPANVWTPTTGSTATAAATASATATIGATRDPYRFLLAVMNNDEIDLHLRIEATKALLPFSATGTRPPPDPTA